jgi:hypothetical protein
MRSSSVVVLLGLADVLLAGCHGGDSGDGGVPLAEPTDTRLDGTWVRAPGLASSGLQTFTIQTLDEGWRVEATILERSSSDGTLHGKPVEGDTLLIRVGLATEVDEVNVREAIAWSDSDRLDFFRSGDGVVRAASWSGVPAIDSIYAARPVILDEGSAGRTLLLPPELARELGLETGEVLIQKSPFAEQQSWLDPFWSMGGWRTANWPAPLEQLPDGGLPFTEWPASRLEVYRDGTYRLYQLVAGRAFSVQGVLVPTPEGRWSFTVQNLSLPLVLDDGSSVLTELSGFAGGEQRGYEA